MINYKKGLNRKKREIDERKNKIKVTKRQLKNIIKKGGNSYNFLYEKEEWKVRGLKIQKKQQLLEL